MGMVKRATVGVKTFLFCVEMSALSDAKETKGGISGPKNLSHWRETTTNKKKCFNTYRSSFNHAHAGAPDSPQPPPSLPSLGELLYKKLPVPLRPLKD